MSFYAASLLATGAASLLLGIFIYLQGANKNVNASLAAFTLAVAMWCLGQAAGELTRSAGWVLFWTRINIAGAIFIPALYLLFVSSFLMKLRFNWAVPLAFLGSVIFLLTDLTPLFVADIAPRLSFRYWPVPGPAYFVFPVFLAMVVGYGFWELIWAYKKSTGGRRNQILYIILASLLGFGGGITAFFPTFNLNFPSLAHFFLPLYVVISIYAILKHNLVDLKMVVRGSLVYSVMTILFAGAYTLLIVVFKEVFQSLTGWNSVLATIGLVFAAVTLFEPVRVRVREGVDALLFRQRYDYQKALRELSEMAVSIFDEHELLDRVARTVKETMKVSSVAILKEGAHPTGFELSLPMTARGYAVGTLNLGPKLSGEMYSPEDIDLLATLANQVAIALENASLYREILQSEKLAVIGRMAAGLAHEIKNPLASIKGLTQILPENLQDPEYVQKFTDIVPRQLDRINNLVETLLKFGRPQKFVMTEVNLSKILSDLLKLIENQGRKKNVVFKAEWEPELLVQGDAEQLMQVFMNLIINALDAMPDGGILRIKGSRREEEGVMVEVSDTGVGIPADKLKNVFDPFFTTKEGGMGLGLAVTYRIIKEHGGEIEVESRRGEGTKFKIWLYTKPRA